MRLTRIEIRNFRSIRRLTLDLGETTVLIGPNNAGKSAILDAMRLALTGPWGRTGTGDAPSGMSIRLCAEESVPGEWPRSVGEEPDPADRSDSKGDRRSLALLTRFARNRENGKVEPRRRLLEIVDGLPSGRGYRQVNIDRCWRYLPVFYLGALRDIDKEYMAEFPRFWERLLKAAEIPAGLESDARDILDRLFSRLKESDPNVKDINTALAGINRGMLLREDWFPDWTMLPAEMLNEPRVADPLLFVDEPDPDSFLLDEKGQGIQSLSIFSMFLAFVRHFLDELYAKDSEPVLLIEEPETHLHPHAVRTLWRHIQAQPGQKIVTTHSPYLVQNTSFRDLRLVRFTGNGTEVSSLPASFSAKVPPLDGLEDAAARWEDLLSYEQSTRTLTVTGTIPEKAYRGLLARYGTHERFGEFARALRELRARSSRYIGDDELRSLETFAQRIRGEIFFAERWLIVEGQADYLIVHALAHAMEYDLDGFRVSVIDAQNNGSPVAFAALARALDIPWLAVFDGDAQGNKYKRQILKLGSDKAKLKQLCLSHSAGDLEEQLVDDGFGSELSGILAELGVRGASNLTDKALVKRLRKKKVGYAAKLADRFRVDPSLARRGPAVYREGIGTLVMLNRKSVFDEEGS